MPPDATARLPLSFPLDLELTLGGLQRGPADPTIRFDANQVWRAARTPDGPATVRLSHVGAGLTADAWGAGAGWMVRHAESLLGFEDHPETFAPANQLLADIHRHHPGLRLGRTGLVFEALLPTILEQKVPGVEAWHHTRAWSGPSASRHPETAVSCFRRLRGGCWPRPTGRFIDSESNAGV